MEIQQTNFVPPPPTSPSSTAPVDGVEGVSAALLAETALNSPKLAPPTTLDVGGGGEGVSNGVSVTITAPLSPAIPEEGADQLSATDLALKKRSYVLQELVETERDYVKDLAVICQEYIPNMKEESLPEGLQGKKDKIIFGNVQSIFEFHRDILLPDLEKYSAGHLPDKEANSNNPNEPNYSTKNNSNNPLLLQLVFCGPRGERQRRLEYIYNVYCENKPKSEAVVGEFDNYFETLRKQLNLRLQLSDYL